MKFDTRPPRGPQSEGKLVRVCLGMAVVRLGPVPPGRRIHSLRRFSLRSYPPRLVRENQFFVSSSGDLPKMRDRT
jgi:hypothetical protein